MKLSDIASRLKGKIRGFTLIESLVAIAVLMVAISGPMYLAQKGLATAELSIDEMTAAFLAQDGMEAVKNIRDQVALGGATSPESWLQPFIDGHCICNAAQYQCGNLGAKNVPYCNIDTTPTNFDKIYKWDADKSIVDPLFIHNDTSGNFLYYDLGSQGNDQQSKFSRYINISTSTNNGAEALVRVRIAWQSNSGPQTVDIQDYMYNYSNNPNITN